MRSCRSFSDAAPASALLLAAFASFLALTPLSGAEGAAPPAAAAARAGSADRTGAQVRTCPRCGYRGEAGWRYCPACGWDLAVLAGSAAGETLSSIGRATVGVIAIRPDPSIAESVAPRLRKYLAYFKWSDRSPARRKVFGSGFAAAPGVFVTASDLMLGAAEVSVRASDNHLHPATLLGIDPASGLAALRVDTLSVAPLEVTPDDAVPRTGWVFCYPVAIEEGIARHLPLSIHAGRVTATGEGGRFVAAFEDLLRTDQAVPHGCAGGPFVDARGRIAGMVIEGREAGLTWLQSLGPMRRAVDALVRGAAPEWPYYGFGLAIPDELRRRRFGLPAGESRLVVPYLIPGSPAQAAGLQAGDLLATVDGEPVPTLREATRTLTRGKPGGPAVRLGILRAGAAREISVLPAGRPANIMLDPMDELSEGLEASFQEVTTGATAQQGLRLVDLAAGGRGAEDGFAVGDLILAVESKRMRSLATFSRTVRDANPHLFPEPAPADETRRRTSTYFVGLDIRRANGEDAFRLHANYFPDRLTAPVY